MRAAVWRRTDARAGTVLVLGLAFVVFSLLDCVTTTYGVLHGAVEENPFQAALLGHGLSAFYELRAAVVTVVLAALPLMPRRPAAWLAFGFTTLTAAAVLSNVLTIFH